MVQIGRVKRSKQPISTDDPAIKIKPRAAQFVARGMRIAAPSSRWPITAAASD